MGASFNAKDAQVFQQQLNVQHLVLPFKIIGNATPADVQALPAQPAILFLRTQGVDEITPALSAGDVATYTESPNDATGVFNVLIVINENLVSVDAAELYKQAATVAAATYQSVAFGNANAVVQNASVNGNKIMLTCKSDVALNAANTLAAALCVDYVTVE